MRKTHPNILELIIKLKEDTNFHDLESLQLNINMSANKRQLKYLDLDQRNETTVKVFEERGKGQKYDEVSS